MTEPQNDTADFRPHGKKGLVIGICVAVVVAAALAWIWHGSMEYRRGHERFAKQFAGAKASAFNAYESECAPLVKKIASSTSASGVMEIFEGREKDTAAHMKRVCLNLIQRTVKSFEGIESHPEYDILLSRLHDSGRGMVDSWKFIIDTVQSMAAVAEAGKEIDNHAAKWVEYAGSRDEALHEDAAAFVRFLKCSLGVQDLGEVSMLTLSSRIRSSASKDAESWTKSVTGQCFIVLSEKADSEMKEDEKLFLEADAVDEEAAAALKESLSAGLRNRVSLLRDSVKNARDGFRSALLDVENKIIANE